MFATWEPGEISVPVPRTDFVKAKKNRQPPKTGRDFWIGMAVKALIDDGFEPTRNWAKRGNEGDPSACAIVAMALNRLRVPITEAAIKKIWERQRGMFKD
jgi:hypothetical protein